MILYHMTWGQTHSLRVISLTDIKGGIFERDVAGIAKSWQRRNQLQWPLACECVLQQHVSCYNSPCCVTTARVLLQQPMLCYNSPCLVTTACVVFCYSDKPVFCWAACVHPGGAGRGDAASDGAESTTYPPHAHRPPVTRHVPAAHRLRHEHYAATHHQTGGSA